jgi:aspartyl-tRNA(Asn)/glutamyl-tRNA(Gln) amidotransferase subunit A
MESYDLLLTPTLAVPPFSVESSGPSEIEGRSVGAFHWLSFTYPVNLTGQPAATIPVDWTDDGLPIGFQIIGKHLADETVLAASAAYEQAYPWQDHYFPMEN